MKMSNRHFLPLEYLIPGILFLIILLFPVTQGSPISISLPLPLASVPQPVTINKHPNGNTPANNDVIGYIVVPYPGIDQRSDPSPISLLLGGTGSSTGSPFGGLGRNYRRLVRAPPVVPPPVVPPYPMIPPLLNPLNSMYPFHPGYPSLYGYSPRIPLINLLG